MNFKDLEKKNFVLDSFDFKHVKSTMDLLDWKWATTDPPMQVPSIFHLKDCASRLMDYAYEESREGTGGKGYCSTGGFVAEYKNENFHLSFVLKEADSMNVEDEKEETPNSPKTQNPILLLSLSE